VRLGCEFEIELLQAALCFRPDNLEALFALGNALTRIGRYEEGLSIDEKLVALLPDNATVHYNLACSLALLRRKEDALHALGRALALGFDDERLLATDPDLAALREDPRFRTLLASRDPGA